MYYYGLVIWKESNAHVSSAIDINSRCFTYIYKNTYKKNKKEY